MTQWTFAAGYFGLPRDGGEYRVLDHSPDFPPTAESALASLGRSFGWRPVGDGNAGAGRRFESCFALWPATGGTLVARLLDDGDDELGRPHTLRIEAAWAPDPAPPTLLAGCLSPAAWPQPASDLTSPLSLRPTEPAESLVARLGHDGRQPVLVAVHENWYAPAFAARIVSQTTETLPDPSEPSGPPGRTGAKQSNGQPGFAAFWLVAVSVLGLLATSCILYVRKISLEEDLQQRVMENSRLEQAAQRDRVRAATAENALMSIRLAFVDGTRAAGQHLLPGEAFNDASVRNALNGIGGRMVEMKNRIAVLEQTNPGRSIRADLQDVANLLAKTLASVEDLNKHLEGIKNRLDRIEADYKKRELPTPGPKQ